MSMKIGVEGRTLQGNRYGVARYLVNLLGNLIQIDHDNRYLLYLSDEIEPLGFEAPNLDFKVVRMQPGILWRHLRLPMKMRADGIDLHFSPAYMLPLVKVCPSIVVVHDIAFKVHPEWFSADRRFLFDGIFWREVKRADRIVTVSEHSKKDIVECLAVDPGRVVVIQEAADEAFRPVDDERKLSSIRERFGLTERFIFTVGSIHTRRNLTRLIEACARAGRDFGIDPMLLIVGTPAPFSPPVDIGGTAERCGIRKEVINVPYVSEEELLLLYNACGLFAYPSLYEGFGLPVIEAMACGTPVACSNTTSIPEVAGQVAIYFDPESVEEMADAIGRGLTDETLRKELARKGRERASIFSWRRAAEETLAVFNQVGGN
jgi:glycosyltransferase involved in cell wall biosynthesis